MLAPLEGGLALAPGPPPLGPLALRPQALLALPSQGSLAPAALVLGAGPLALGPLALQPLPPFPVQLLGSLALETLRAFALPLPLGLVPLAPTSLLGLVPLALTPFLHLAPLPLELLRPGAALSLRLLLTAALALRATVVVVLRAGIERSAADLDREIVVSLPAAQIAGLEARIEGGRVIGALGLGRIASGLTVVLGERLGDAAPLVGRG